MIPGFFLITSAIVSTSCEKDALKNSLRDPDSIINNSTACKVLSINKVYDVEKHCAFTDLTKWSGKWYLVFRTSDNHAYTKNGVIKVLKSADGVKWENEVSYEAPDMDLRDPKFITTRDGRLKVFTQGVKFNPDKTVNYQRGVVIEAEADIFNRDKPYTIFYDRKAYWPWRFSNQNNISYAIGYGQSPNVFQLVKTTDFKHIEEVCDLSQIQRTPTEATLRFRKDSCYVLVRRSGPTLLGISNVSDICNLTWTELPLIGLGGPNFLFYDDNTLLISGRDYANQNYSYANNRTSLFVYKIKEKKTYRILTLPTSGDTSYPGLYLSENELWISYHSSHEGPTKIYLAKVELALDNL